MLIYIILLKTYKIPFYAVFLFSRIYLYFVRLGIINNIQWYWPKLVIFFSLYFLEQF